MGQSSLFSTGDHRSPPGTLSRRRLLVSLSGLGVGAGLHRHRALGQETPTTDLRQPTPVTGPILADAPQRSGGVLTIAMREQPLSLNPFRAQPLTRAYDLIPALYEGLIRVDARQRFRPLVAAGVSISEDEQTYTFRLRPNARFHDGARVTATDVIASLTAYADPEFGALLAPGWNRLAAVSAPTEQTVIIQTDGVFAPFLANIATAPILPASHLVDGPEAFDERQAEELIGSGPFRLASAGEDDAIRLERFDDYWGRPALLDAIEIQLLSPEDQLAALIDGVVHVTPELGRADPSLVDRALAEPDLTVLSHTTQEWVHLELKQLGPLRECPVRRALAAMTPRTAIIDAVRGGRATPAVADQVPGSWAAHPDLTPRREDTLSAAQHLREAGFVRRDGLWRRDGASLSIDLWGVADNPAAERAVGLITEQWRDNGIDVTPRFGPPEEIWGPEGYQFTETLSAGLTSWSNFNDPDNLFYWHSSQIPTEPGGPGGNISAYFNEFAFQNEIDTLIVEALATTDQDERRERYWRIQEILRDEVPAIFLYWVNAHPVALPTVGGFWPSPFTNLTWNAASWFISDAR